MKVTREFKYLNAEHMTGILKQRALELEADIYAQETERELAKSLDQGSVIEATSLKIELFENALAEIEAEIEKLEDREAAPPPPKRRSSK